ncbi:Cytochrome b-c1 complex subunit 7 [Quaeritorhiza haematococci]|nr:Cytochrome b-c1 complex subunit 7 [Quaeritorhiza haematococci]
MSFLQSLKNLRNSKAVSGLSEWYSNQMGYRKMGLRFDDLIPDESDVVQQAVSRLPPKEFYDRVFRFRRALHLSGKQETLPPEMWTKPEQDVPYLRPIIEQIEAEMTTKQNFDQMVTIPAALLKRNRST